MEFVKIRAVLRFGGWWLPVSLVVHALALLAWFAVWPEAPAPAEAGEPILVAVLHDATPPERELSREFLHFRKPTHPRVRETISVAREVLALAAPPPDARTLRAAAGGGFSIRLPENPGRRNLQWGGGGGGWAGTGFGAGNGRALEGTFQEYVGGLRQIGLDVVFVIDATGSMGWLIAEVKQRVRLLSDWIRDLVPVTRFGVVAYRDDDDPEFLTRVAPLTLRIGLVRRFLDRLEARGGGDIPEGVTDGLRAAVEHADWKRDSKKVIVIIGDAPPHAAALEAALGLARDFRARGGSVTTVDVSFDANPQLAAARLGVPVEALTTLDGRGVMESFVQLAEAGGGDASSLEGEQRVVRQLAVLIFGRRWEAAVRPLLGEL